MPHRGRLNLLTDVLKYSLTALFHKIKGGPEIPESLGAQGDVISHLGPFPLPHLSSVLIPQILLLSSRIPELELRRRCGSNQSITAT
jgi:probable 2-oxoglutarate dehydrogenase E1 component DHKTD1